MNRKINVRLPESHPHITQTFHLLSDRNVIRHGEITDDKSVCNIFTVAVADHRDFLNINLPDSHLALQIREFAHVYKDMGIKLLIDGATEGWPFRPIIFESLHIFLEKHGIDPHSVIMVTTNHVLPLDYNKWAHASHIRSISFFLYDYWVFKISQKLNEDLARGMTSVTKAGRRCFHVDKKILSYNRIPKAHRAAVVLLLIKQDSLNSSIVSFMPDSKPLVWSEVEKLRHEYDSLRWHSLKDLMQGFESLVNLVPLTHDQTSNDEYLSYVFGGLTSADYDQVGCAVITESDFGTREVDRVTEKPFKAVANCCPFLLVGQPFQLSRLKKLGFEEYTMFNNKYDEILDPDARLSFLLHEIERLISMSTAELELERLKMVDTCEKNFHQLKNYCSDYNIDQVSANILSALDSMPS